MRIGEKVKDMIKSWLDIYPPQAQGITIQERLDFTANAIKNRIWYRGKSEELSELYKQLNIDRTAFWSAVPTKGMEIRKVHTGLPRLIVDVLTSIVVSDMNNIDVSPEYQDIWDNIEKENSFTELISECVAETLIIGDGAFKISFDNDLSEYPIIEFVPGDNIEINRKRGRVSEVVFITTYEYNHKKYFLKEYYGYGYIITKLFYNNHEVNLQ